MWSMRDRIVSSDDLILLILVFGLLLNYVTFSIYVIYVHVITY